MDMQADMYAQCTVMLLNHYGLNVRVIYTVFIIITQFIALLEPEWARCVFAPVLLHVCFSHQKTATYFCTSVIDVLSGNTCTPT